MTASRAELVPGYSISRVIKGGWHLAGGHGPIDRMQAIEDMAAFVEAGITTFDCADIYAGVEGLIGDFRRAYPELAARVQVHTKFVPDLDRLGVLEPREIEAIINRSRTRLGMDTLDLVQFHWWDVGVPGYVHAAQELARLRAAGKIRHVGLTNFNTSQTREIIEAGVPIVSSQVQFSLLDDRPTRGFADYCLRNGVRLLCYGSLAGGFFSADWLGQPEPTGPFENRSLTKYKLIIDDFGGWALFQALLEVLQKIAHRRNRHARHLPVSLAEVASSWVLHQPGVVVVIVGVTSSRHLVRNTRIPDIKLSRTDMQDIARVAGKRNGPVGDVYDLERDRTGRHGRIMKYNLNRD
jgi:aryl-alcohol dehydrogenase-like predicted oxidoreductase